MRRRRFHGTPPRSSRRRRLPPKRRVRHACARRAGAAPALAVPWVLFIALAPGLCEETLFRGYVQRRLIERWPAGAAILVTSLIFAIFHIMPHAVVFAFPIGIWLGILAWKSGSVWPGVICHATINGAWNIFQVGAHLDLIPDVPPLAILVLGSIVGVAAFLGSLRLMFWSGSKSLAPTPAV